MVKALTAPYAAGGAGGAWLKVKPVHTLDLVVLARSGATAAAVAGCRNLHLGAREPDGGFVHARQDLQGADRRDAHVADRAAAGAGDGPHGVPRLRAARSWWSRSRSTACRRSPRYPGGVALRFARVLRHRPDKRADEADTLASVRAIHDANMTRRTNLALAVVLGAATATGVLSLLIGDGRVALVVWAHGAVGLAVLALIRPKSRIAVRGTVRRGMAAAPGLLLGGLVTVSMGLGIAHAMGVGTLGPLTALGWHIGLALAAVPVAAAHVWRRPPRLRTGDLTRRPSSAPPASQRPASPPSSPSNGWPGARAATARSTAPTRPTAWLDQTIRAT